MKHPLELTEELTELARELLGKRSIDCERWVNCAMVLPV